MKTAIFLLSILLISVLCVELNAEEAEVSIVDSILADLEVATHDTSKLVILLTLIDNIHDDNIWPKYNEQAMEIALRLTNSKNISEVEHGRFGLATVYNNLAYLKQIFGDYKTALKYYELAAETNESIGNDELQATIINNIAYIYENFGDIEKALKNYHKSLAISEKLNDESSQAYCFNNLGSLYERQDEREKAIECYTKSHELAEKHNDDHLAAVSLNNIGLFYKRDGEYDKALKIFEQALELYSKINYEQGKATALNNIGTIYSANNQISEAIRSFEKSLDIYKRIDDPYGQVSELHNLGSEYMAQGKIRKAEELALEAFKLSKEIGFPVEISRSALLLTKIYQKIGNYSEALNMHIIYLGMRDSVENIENQSATIKSQMKYEYQKEALADSIENVKAMEIKDLSLAKKEEENKNQRILLFAFIIGFLLIIIFSIFLYRMLIQKKKANIILGQQKEEIETQRDEITSQRDQVQKQKDQIEDLYDITLEQKNLVEHQKEEIEGSIRYAKSIQAAVLPSEELSRSILGEHFILFRPHSVVSGDFYWATQLEEWIIVAVADCTGHGVPGAFMSMLGISFLNEIVRKKEVTNAALVLNQLRISVIDALKQTGETGTQKDGMDMSLASINTNNKQCQWAGANNPLYIIRPKAQDPNSKSQGAICNNAPWDLELGAWSLEFTEIKGDKMPVAVHECMKDFSCHVIEIQPQDQLYLFTDGFPDQFGGPKGKKFKYKPFKRILVENSDKPMQEQKQALEKSLDEWQDHLNPYDKKPYEQVDDITVVGIRIK